MTIKIGAARTTGRKLRIALFGKDSAGKTHFGLSGPGPVVVYDAEGRIQAMTDVFGEIPIVTYDERKIAYDLVEAAIGLRAGRVNAANGKPFETFVIDSWTAVQKAFEKSVGIDTISDPATRIRNLGDIRKKIENELLNPILTGPTQCHIVVTAHEALEWTAAQKVGGVRPDATRNFKHYFDLVFHMQREPVTQPGQLPHLHATVVKSNYQHVLPIGMRIEHLSWEHLSEIITGNVAIIPIPTEQLIALHVHAGSPNDSLGKWLVANGFDVSNKQIQPADTHRAQGMLESLIEEGEATAS